MLRQHFYTETAIRIPMGLHFSCSIINVFQLRSTMLHHPSVISAIPGGCFLGLRCVARVVAAQQRMMHQQAWISSEDTTYKTNCTKWAAHAAHTELLSVLETAVIKAAVKESLVPVCLCLSVTLHVGITTLHLREYSTTRQQIRGAFQKGLWALKSKSS